MIIHDKKQMLKFLGGGLIIAVAFAIMAPGLVSYVMGLWRLITLIVTIVSVAFLLVYVFSRLSPRKKPEPQESQDDIA